MYSLDWSETENVDPQTLHHLKCRYGELERENNNRCRQLGCGASKHKLFCAFQDPHNYITHILPNRLPFSDRALVAEDPHEMFESPGLLFDRYQETFGRIFELEDAVRKAEMQLDHAIKLHPKFFAGPIDSALNGQFVGYPTFKLSTLDAVSSYHSDSSLMDQKLIFQEAFKRTAYLLKWVKIAQNDADRLYKGTHDGKSPRHYPEGDRSPGAVLDERMPWYLSNDNVKTGPEAASSIGLGDCRFCILDRRLFECEYEMWYLVERLKTLGNKRGIPQEVGEAMEYYKKELGPNHHKFQSQDLSDNAPDGNEINRMPRAIRRSFFHFESAPWEIDRFREFAVRTFNLEGMACNLENQLDFEIFKFTHPSSKDRAQAEAGIPRKSYPQLQPASSFKVPMVRFNSFNPGPVELCKVMFMSQNGAQEELVADLFRRCEFLRAFQTVALKDIECLSDGTHDGRSCRYFPTTHDLVDIWGELDPLYPWYVQEDNVNLSLEHFHVIHSDEINCTFCILDRKCLQLEADMEFLFGCLKRPFRPSTDVDGEVSDQSFSEDNSLEL